MAVVREKGHAGANINLRNMNERDSVAMPCPCVCFYNRHILYNEVRSVLGATAKLAIQHNVADRTDKAFSVRSRPLCSAHTPTPKKNTF